ncbi:MAG: choice-of-anchor J domain-containing protein, partial [Bacteroidales bacterium]
MKRLLFFLMAMIFAIQGWTQVDVQIGNGTTNYYDPLPGWYGWNRSAYLYKADEIGVFNGGTINSISFQIQSASTGSTAQLNVYIKDTSIAQMPSLASSNWNGLKTGATLVYQSTAFAGSPVGWITITFTTPYVYNGTSNLVVYIEGQGCSTSGGCASQCYNHVSTASHWYCRKDTSAPDDNAASVSSTGQENNRANIKFNITPNGDFCYPPDNLLASNITTSSADLAWTTNASGNSWVVQYKPSLDATWSADDYATSGSYLLQGLTASSAYDVRIKSICATDESSWRTISFRTACGAITDFPWEESFETTPWAAAVAPGNALAPDCWININGGYSSTSYIWRRTSTAAYVHSGTGAAQMYTSASYATNDWLITPSITLNGSERLRFWAKGYSTYVDQIGVRIYDITTNSADIALVTDTTLFTEIMPNTLVSATAWTEYEINLSQYSGDYRIAFVRNTVGGYYLNIDDVSISTIPSCTRPSAITLDAAMENNLELSWTNGNVSDASWYIYYAPTGTTIYDSVLASSNPFTLTGLNASTGYDIYMRTVCGSDLSEATSVSTFYTACGAITDFPWTEGFESNWTPAVAPGNQSAPNCWTVVDKGGVNGTYQYWWKKGTTPAHTGSGHAVCYTDYGTTGHNDWLITPQLSLTGDERLRFWAMRSSSSTTEPDEISVFISDGNITTLDTTGMGIMGNMSGFTQIFTQMLPVSDWQQYEISLDQYAGTRYIAFVRQNTPDGYNLRLDDVSVDPIPACARPTQLANTAVSQTTADVSWLPGHAGDASWYLYYKASTSTNYDSVQVTSNPFQLQNLTSNTIYNVYMKTDCSTELSEATPIITFNTPCDAIITLPYTEAFDTYGTGSPIIPTCWRKITTYSTYPYITTTYSSSPASLYFYALSGTYNIAVTPPFDSSIPINTLLATFKMRKSNATSNVIVGVMTNPNDPSTFDTIATVAPIATTTWETLEVNFSDYQGTGEYIAFKSAYNTTTNYFYLDDVSVDLIPTCARASALTFSAIDTSSALVSWTAGNPSDASWWFYWKPTSSTTYDSLLISSNPYTLTNLTPNTPYDVYVTTDCGTLLSEPSNVFSFRTACAPIITLPYTENFDTYGTGSTIFPACWTKITTYSTYPYINTTYSSAPGALYFYTTSGTYNIAATPIFDASIPLNTLMASFKLRKSNATSNITVGVMTDPTDATTFDSITTVSPSTTGVFEQFEVNLSSYTGIGQYVAFKVAYNTTTNYIYLDDLSIGVIPLCPNTYSLAVASVTSSDITLNWSTMNSVGQGWEISYDAVGTGFDPNVTGPIVTVADAVGVPPYTITGLTSSTPYSFAVRQACGGNWSNIVTTNTMGLPAQLPYTCDFEDVDEQNSWSISNGGATNKWFIGTAVSATPITGTSLYVSNDNGLSNTYTVSSAIGTVVASRLIEFDGAGGYTLTFDSRLGGESSYDYIKVYVVDQDTTFVGDASTPYYGTTSYSTGEVLFNGTNAYFNNVSNPTTVNNHAIELPYQGDAGTIKKLMFVWRNDGSGGTLPPASIDNITITPITCAAPALTISNIAQTTADASWTATASDAAWWLYWKEASATDYDSVYVTVTPSYSFSTLIANTPYNSYVRLDCGTELSDPSTVINFRTACDAILAFPFSENFDTYGTGTTVMPACWTRTTTYADRPYVNTGGHSGNCLYFYAGTAGTYNIAAMTPIDASIPINTLMATFYYKNNNANDKLVLGVMTDPTDATTFDSITTIIAPTTGTWAEYEANFSSYSGIGQYIAFKNAYTTTGGYAYIDDLVIDIIPTCARPTTVSTTNGVATSVDVTFIPGNATDAGWYVYYKSATSTDWDSIYTTLIPATLSNLTLQTTYQIYVKTDCGDGTNSNASNIITYTTPCYSSAINTFPWAEGFENGINCWTINSSAISANWTSETSGTWPTATPHSGSNMIMFNSNNISSGGWSTIYSPILDFPNNQYQVSFWLFKDDDASYLTTADRVELYINSTASETGATLLGTVNRSINLAPIQTSIGWYQYSYTLPAGITGNQYVILKGISLYGRNIYVDDVMVDVLGTPCASPTNVTVPTATITNTTATVNWTAGDQETSWQVRLDLTG